MEIFRSRASARLRDRLVRHVTESGVRSTDRDRRPVTELDVASLPEPAQRYLRFMEVVGRPRDLNFTARFRGRFRMRPQGPWMPFDAWQYNCSSPVTRIVDMRIDAFGLVPMLGSDTYIGGTGRMVGKLLGRYTVADGRGREFDLGELVTYLNDAVLLAPATLLTPATTWSPVDDESFRIELTDRGHSVSGRVVVAADGRVRDFHTTDRWWAGADPPVRTPWSTPIERWVRTADGRRCPGACEAVWHFPDGESAYIRGAFDPSSVVFDVDPQALDRAGDVAEV
jgi:hypothetical protein